jgi:hypothetical protein
LSWPQRLRSYLAKSLSELTLGRAGGPSKAAWCVIQRWRICAPDRAKRQSEQ